MVCGKNYKTIDIRKEDADFMEELRKTPIGNVSYATAFHSLVEFWKDQHKV